MPLYEYECLECKDRFERRQAVNDEPIKVCEKCGGRARRVFNSVGIIFKGSGFYATDNRKPHYGEGAKTDEKPAAEKKEDVKSEVGAAKGESKASGAESKPSKKEEAKAGANSSRSD